MNTSNRVVAEIYCIMDANRCALGAYNLARLQGFFGGGEWL
jgi:hypothetical protein